MNFPKIKLTKGMTLRMVADVILVNAALFSAIFLKLLVIDYFLPRTSLIDPHPYWVNGDFELISQGVQIYAQNSILLTMICIAIFSLSGFYTHGRTYRSRFKVLLIFQGVTLSYLIIAFVNYMFYPGNVFSRSLWFLGWIVTFAFVGGARLWSALWRSTITFETKIGLSPHPKLIQNVLVIGGAGYLGSVLVRKLLSQGYNVRILDLLIYGDTSIRDLYAYERRFGMIRGDFRNIDVIVKAMDKIDAVVHLGAIVGDPACQIDHDLTFDTNLLATKMIAEVARGFGVHHFLFASTCSVYGANDQLLTEKSQLNPQSLYAKTKIASEEVLLEMKGNGFHPIILRFATLYGMSFRPRFDLVINLLAAKAVCDKEITIFGGEQWRPFVHVKDAAEAIIKCLEMAYYPNLFNVFNVGSDGQNYRISQIGQLIKEILPDIKVNSLQEEHDHRNYKVSFNRIHNALGFEPKYDIEDGIVEICTSFEHGLISDYKDSKYNNYKFLSEDHCFTRFKFDLIPKNLFADSSGEKVMEAE